jgi:hypothetical protein
MLSLDPIIERGYGYPLLYQSGELYRGEQIHDRQHPHDFFSELAVTYSYKFNDKNSFFLYAGYPGEPALGPPAFMHRLSGMDNPDAPLGHHWQDATHITWGVVTAGFNFGKYKIEASAFKGEEPDENRWNFDKPKLDSFSTRLSFNPTKNWAFQISHGYLKNPEPSEPDLTVLRRTTASAIYNKKFSAQQIEHFAFCQISRYLVLVIVGTVFWAAFFIQCQEASKGHHRPGSAEEIRPFLNHNLLIPCINVYRHRIVPGRCHLAGHKSIPD